MCRHMAWGATWTSQSISYALALLRLPQLFMATYFVRGVETFSELAISLRRLNAFLALPEPPAPAHLQGTEARKDDADVTQSDIKVRCYTLIEHHMLDMSLPADIQQSWASHPSQTSAASCGRRNSPPFNVHGLRLGTICSCRVWSSGAATLTGTTGRVSRKLRWRSSALPQRRCWRRLRAQSGSSCMAFTS